MVGLMLSSPVTMTSAITDALGSIIKWVGSVVTALISGDLKDLLPIFAIGIAVSVLMLGVKAIKSFAWGS